MTESPLPAQTKKPDPLPPSTRPSVLAESRAPRSSAPLSPGRAALPRVILEICRGHARHRFRPVEVSVFLIGSGTECDLVLADPGMPNVQMCLLISPERVGVRQVGGGPRIEVRGQATRLSRLGNGDRIRTGPYEFCVHIARPLARLARGNRHVDTPHTLRGPHAPFPATVPWASDQDAIRDTEPDSASSSSQPASPPPSAYVHPDHPWLSLPTISPGISHVSQQSGHEPEPEASRTPELY